MKIHDFGKKTLIADWNFYFIDMSDFYDFQATDIRGQLVEMSQFKGKVVLVVNTASKCGFTPQYKGLEELYQEFESEGLVILAFPCNQFGKQEPGDHENIITDCLNVFNINFPVFTKTKVNGSQAHPVFQWLKAQKRGFFTSDIKWNFTKFLIDREGNVAKRYAPSTEPSKIKDQILALIDP